MTTFHAGRHSVWRALRRLTAGAEPLDAAIAWIADASLLRAKPGDRIVLDASDQAVKSRSTSADAVKALIGQGAELWSLPGLHAKTMVIGGRTLIAGSMNASVRADRHLVEAAIETEDRRSVDRALKWLAQLRKKATLINEARLNQLLRIRPNPRDKQSPAAGAAPETGGESDKPSQYWLFASHSDAKGSPYVDQAFDTLDAEAAKPTNRGFEFFFHECEPGTPLLSRIREGDIFFEATFGRNNRIPSHVYEPATVWYLEPVEDWTFVHYHMRNGAERRPLSWARFRKLANSCGQKLGRPGGEFKLNDAAARRMIANWPVERKRRGRRA